jgi:hypothetical protein
LLQRKTKTPHGADQQNVSRTIRFCCDLNVTIAVSRAASMAELQRCPADLADSVNVSTNATHACRNDSVWGLWRDSRTPRFPLGRLMLFYDGQATLLLAHDSYPRDGRDPQRGPKQPNAIA